MQFEYEIGGGSPVGEIVAEDGGSGGGSKAMLDFFNGKTQEVYVNVYATGEATPDTTVERNRLIYGPAGDVEDTNLSTGTFLPGEVAGMPDNGPRPSFPVVGDLLEQLRKFGESTVGAIRSGYSASRGVKQTTSSSEVVRDRTTVVPSSGGFSINDVLSIFGLGRTASGSGTTTAPGTGGPKPGEKDKPGAGFSFAQVLPFLLLAVVGIVALKYLARKGAIA